MRRSGKIHLASAVMIAKNIRTLTTIMPIPAGVTMTFPVARGTMMAMRISDAMLSTTAEVMMPLAKDVL